MFDVRRLLCVVSTTLVLALGGCGEDTITVKSGGTADDGSAKEVVATLGVELGLWDPSPRRGREVQGQMTYAFKPAPAGAKPVEGGSVAFGILEDIDSFNPFLSSSVTASEVQDLIFPRLMSEQPNYYDGVPTFDPQIAESWVIAPDNLSIRFKLRACVWSDDTPISSDDVRFSWQAASDPDVAWVSSSIVDFIRDVEVHSPREFTVHYTNAQPYNLMDINDVQIVPKHTFGLVPFGNWRGYAEWSQLATRAAGGPWMLDKHDPGQVIVVKANPKYWDAPKPYLDKIEMKIFGQMDSMLLGLRAGEVDVMTGVTPGKAKQVLEAEHLELYTYVTRSYGYLGYNCKRAPFDDKRVRQALTYAINRRNIVEAIFAGYAEEAAPNIIRSMWASKRSLKPYPYDTEKALALLAEAGWTQNTDGKLVKDGKPFTFKLQTNSGNVVRKQICEFVLADLATIGIDAEIQLTDFNQMSEQLKKHNFDAYVAGWYIATKIDPKPTFHSVSVDGRYNYVNFVNEELDQLIDKGRVMNIADPAIRAEAQKVWDRFQDILYDEQPYTMIYEPRGLVGVNKRYVNVRVTSLRALDNVHEWWIAK
ncbi:MAG: ABC transporter substrate-binding protein [Planctomycetota bacterium]|nr:ABC transporter substrate-binding protein [Planctomycetota bacterium]